MCSGAGIDLWEDRSSAGALGSVVITGRTRAVTRPRENNRRTKKARRRIQKNVTLFFVTPIGPETLSGTINPDPLVLKYNGRDRSFLVT